MIPALPPTPHTHTPRGNAFSCTSAAVGAGRSNKLTETGRRLQAWDLAMIKAGRLMPALLFVCLYA